MNCISGGMGTEKSNSKEWSMDEATVREGGLFLQQFFFLSLCYVTGNTCFVQKPLIHRYSVSWCWHYHIVVYILYCSMFSLLCNTHSTLSPCLTHSRFLSFAQRSSPFRSCTVEMAILFLYEHTQYVIRIYIINTPIHRLYMYRFDFITVLSAYR